MALSIRVAGAGGMFVGQVLLARSLGAAGFGEYALAITWLQVLTVLAKLGLDNTSLRYVSEYVTKQDTERLSGFAQDSIRAAAFASAIIMSLLLVTVLVLWNRIGVTLAVGLIMAALMIPLVAIRQVQEASLRGIGKLFESQLGAVVWPWTMCLLAGGALFISPTGMSSRWATLLHLISVGVVAVLVHQFYRKSRISESLVSVGEVTHRPWRSQRRQRRALQVQQAARDLDRQRWKHTAMAFLIAEILIVLKSRACVALAGFLLDRESVGLYGAMEKFADVTVLASQSLGMVIAPQFASLYAAGQFSEMRRLMKQGQILGLATTLPVAIGVVCFGDFLFVLLGPEYREGWSVLMALLASACIASFSGPAAYVLQMTGHERTMLMITAASAATNIVLSLVLMKFWGLTGLGLAQMATSLVWMLGVRWSLACHPVWRNQPTAKASTTRRLGPEVTVGD